jgi:hypothetical protein
MSVVSIVLLILPYNIIMVVAAAADCWSLCHVHRCFSFVFHLWLLSVCFVLFCFCFCMRVSSCTGFKESFYPFYVATALTRFFFVLDAHRKRKLSIRDLISSDPFRQFNEMRQVQVDEKALLSNWFSPRAALRVRGMCFACL